MSELTRTTNSFKSEQTSVLKHSSEMRMKSEVQTEALSHGFRKGENLRFEGKEDSLSISSGKNSYLLMHS